MINLSSFFMVVPRAVGSRVAVTISRIPQADHLMERRGPRILAGRHAAGTRHSSSNGSAREWRRNVPEA